MRRLQRVVWSEGMHLGPQHFQTQARYFEDTIQFATESLWQDGYGYSGFALDPEALRNGTLALNHARGIFPDGLAFQMPECDPLPPPRNIVEDFPPLVDRMRVYLGVPAFLPDGVNCAIDEPAATRYQAELQPLGDENTGRDERNVRLGRKNIAFYLESELRPELISMPVARVVRGGAGRFLYDADFIPPCLTIGASERILFLLRRLVEILGEKSRVFQRTVTAGGAMAAGFSQGEVAGFWFLHAVNSSLATLRNQLLARRGHPVDLYLELARLAGALCTFGLDSHPAKLALYDHAGLEACLGALDEHIRFHLDTVVPTACTVIALEPAGHYLHFGTVADQRTLGRSQWIFAIRARMGEADLIRTAPQLIKICSKQFVPKLVERALPGLALTHLPAPPSAVSPRVEFQYFSVTKAGPCWDHIAATREVGVYVPGEFPEAEISLAVVVEG